MHIFQSNVARVAAVFIIMPLTLAHGTRAAIGLVNSSVSNYIAMRLKVTNSVTGLFFFINEKYEYLHVCIFFKSFSPEIVNSCWNS